jgi:hypothetical protein
MKFETWYYQLLLSIFDIEISSSTKLSAPKDADEETVSTMNKYFQIDFTKSNSLDFIGKIYDKIKEDAPNCLRQPKIQTSTSSYLSYAWKDDIDNNREKWVNETETTLTDKGVKVFRDKNELTIQDSIQAFMNRIGRGRAAVIVVSDKYLKSEYCMYEAWSIFKNDNFLDRAFIMILPDAHIDRDEDKTKYISFWQSKTNEIRKRIEEDLNSDFLAVDEFMSSYKGEMYILLFINQFLKILSDQIWFRVIEEKTDEDAKTNKANFEMFIQKILTKLNEG